MYEVLTDDNIIMFSILHYTNTQCVGISEFLEDFKKIVYIKKLFTQYEKTGKINHRLILNHLILLYNVFDYKSLNRILYFKIPKKHHTTLKVFMVYLNRESENDVLLDEKVVNILREEG